MTQTPTPEQLQDALRCIPLAIDNNKYIGCTGQHHKNFLKEFEESIQFALRFTAKALGEPSEGMVDAYIKAMGGTISTHSGTLKGHKTKCKLRYSAMIQQLCKECAE